MDQTRTTKSALATLKASSFGPNDVMRLFKSTFVPDQLSRHADFVAQEVAFDGYVSWILGQPWVAGLSPIGDARCIYNGIASFSQGGVLVNDIAGGWWIEDAGGTVLKLYDRFANPVIFDRIGNKALIKPSVELTMLSYQDLEIIVGP